MYDEGYDMFSTSGKSSGPTAAQLKKLEAAKAAEGEVGGGGEGGGGGRDPFAASCPVPSCAEPGSIFISHLPRVPSPIPLPPPASLLFSAGQAAGLDPEGRAAAGTLGQLAVAELKTVLRAWGLPLSGKKDDLILRINAEVKAKGGEVGTAAVVGEGGGGGGRKRKAAGGAAGGAASGAAASAKATPVEGGGRTTVKKSVSEVIDLADDDY